MNRKQRRKQAAQEGKTVKPSAIIPKQVDSTVNGLMQAKYVQGYYAGENVGYRKGVLSSEAIHAASEGQVMRLVELIVEWRDYCQTVDILVKAKLPDNLLKSSIDFALKDAIRESYEAIIKAWDQMNASVSEFDATGRGFGEFDDVRPDIKMATEARQQAIEALHAKKTDTAPIRALPPININPGDFINPVKVGRTPGSISDSTKYLRNEWGKHEGDPATVRLAILDTIGIAETRPNGSKTGRYSMKPDLSEVQQEAYIRLMSITAEKRPDQFYRNLFNDLA